MPKAVCTATFAIAAIFFAAMAGVRGTTATFSDQVTSTGNAFTAATLAAPDLTAPTNVNVVTLNWSDTDAFVTSFRLYRSTSNDCSNPIDLGPSTSGATDAPASPGTYYYRVVATYYNWTKPSNCRMATTSSPQTKLYPTTGSALIDAAGSGNESLGCSTVGIGALGLNICLSPLNPQNTVVFTSAQSYTIASNIGWVVQLNLTVRQLLSLNLLSQGMDATLWYVPASGTCGAPIANQTIATGNASILGLISALTSTTDTVNFAISPVSPFTAPTSPSRICLQISGNPSLLSAGVFLHVVINNGSTSFIQGPFAP